MHVCVLVSQSSAPALGIAHNATQRSLSSSAASKPVRPASITIDSTHHHPNSSHPEATTESPITGKDTLKVTPPPQATESSVLEKNLNSPRQRLQVAEMVMRKLYRKNLQTEELVAKLEQENAQLTAQVKQLQREHSQAPASSTPETGLQEKQLDIEARPATNDNSVLNATALPHIRPDSVASVPVVHAPTLASITRLDEQQLDYLRHLAAEQDKTITSLKVRIEDLSTQLEAARRELKQTQRIGASSRPGGKATTTPRQVVTRLQSKLQDALSESERQRSNYIKLKRDFQHLLGLKTKTLYENPAQLNASARALVELMEKTLAQLEHEHAQHLSLYNDKLYDVEQQTCASYAQQKLMEQEVERIALDVKQRDDVDVQIEQCMVSVFERLRQVETENVLLKSAAAPVQS